MFNASHFPFLCRKDIYGVYAEPVDPEEVTGRFLRDVFAMQFASLSF